MILPALPSQAKPLDEVHGGADPAELDELGLCPEHVLDFSANVNPFGPTPEVQRAIEQTPVDRYPDRGCRALTHELAARHEVEDEQLLVANGSSELIWLTAMAHVRPGDEVSILGPTFSGYQRAARLMRAKVTNYEARADDSFAPPFATFIDGISSREPRLAFLANPNNPTGQSVALDDIFAAAARHPRTLFVLDEAYADCVRRSGPRRLAAPANVIRLRSLTKAHGLAGLRLGYAFGAADVIAALRATQPPWSVNALAQAAGLAAVRDEDHLRHTRNCWLEAHDELTARLRAAGFAPLSSQVPFFLLPVPDAARMRSLLLRRGILVRDCTSFGLPEHLRISARQPEDNARLVTALVQARAEIA